jgi:hypothetical protein
MRTPLFLACSLALLLLAPPSLAHHADWHHPPGQAKKEGDWTPPGQAKKQGDWTPPGQAKKQAQAEGDAPAPGPGNSANVHWCKANWWRDDTDDGPFAAFSACVTFYAHGLRTAADDEEDAAEDRLDRSKRKGDGSDDRHGQLGITDYTVRRDGTFTVRGVGAEERVVVSVGGVSGLVVGFGMTDEIGADGDWAVEGEWACQDSDTSHEARFRAFDADAEERVSTVATFPCRAED